MYTASDQDYQHHDTKAFFMLPKLFLMMDDNHVAVQAARFICTVAYEMQRCCKTSATKPTDSCGTKEHPSANIHSFSEGSLQPH